VKDSLQDLVDRYHHGELNAKEFTALEQRLAADEEERSQFRRLARLEANLRAHATGKTSDMAAWGITQIQVGRTAQGVLTAASEPIGTGWLAPFRFQNSAKWRFAAISSLAASLLIGFFVWRGVVNRSDNRLIELGDGPVDPYLAIVIDQSSNAQWANSRSPRGIGHAIGREKVALENGEATLLLDNGVELLMRGPAELELMSVDHGVLQRGQISARVPENAIGFRLDAPGVNVVDLGTEFSLAVDGRGQPKVHVFKGKVRAALPSMPDSRTELNSGESASFDVALGKVSRGQEDPSLFPVLEDDSQAPHTTGNVRYLRRPPESVKAGTFEHDSIVVFQEQSDFTLPEEVKVVRNASNQQESSEPSVPDSVTLPAGTRVQSYYVHFDRVGSDKKDVESKGSITFDRRVLGLVIPYMQLKQTDAWLVHPDTSYETSGNRLLEMRFMGWKPKAQRPNTSGRFDEVHVSEDGLTISMDLLTGWGIDQFRVLIEAETKE
jgi:hypothetical protein